MVKINSQNNDQTCPDITAKSVGYWIMPKRKLLEMIIEGSLSRMKMAQNINRSTRTVRRWISESLFQKALAQNSEEWKNQITMQHMFLSRELVRKLAKRVKESMNEISPNVVLTEYRKLLISGFSKVLSVGPQKDNPVKQKKVSFSMSPKATKAIEKNILKMQGYQELDVSKEEIEAVQKENIVNRQ